MSTFKNTQITRWIAIAASFLIVSLILWNTYVFFQKFKEEERVKMEILGKSFERFSNLDLDADFGLESYIIGSNNTIPMIVTKGNGDIVTWENLKTSAEIKYDSLNRKDKTYIDTELSIMKSLNTPIEFSFKTRRSNIQQHIYYRNSDLLNKLKYYPIALILILLLFAGVIYLFFKSNKVADQNKLWTGMAKETAHQIGTPLSSLLGWIELLRLENIDENIVPEIEKDVNRLNVIADRFSKIGSRPVLKKHDIVKETEIAFDYLKSRSSKQVIFTFNSSHKVSYANINLPLFGWVIENLVKNAIDAMKGKGKLSVKINETEKNIDILISDTGNGIPKNIRKQIFSPGFTTKKRGWGLGLSLSKRIVNEYHNGKISVKKSEVGKGTTFCVSLLKN